MMGAGLAGIKETLTQPEELFNYLFKGKLSHGGRYLSIGADGNVGHGGLLRMGPVGS